MDPEKHVLTNYHKDIPYEFKDFKVDLDFESKKLDDLRENYKTIPLKERDRFNSLNKHIYDRRWEAYFLIFRKKLTPWKPKKKSKERKDPLRDGNFFLLQSEEDLKKYPDLLDRLNVHDLNDD